MQKISNKILVIDVGNAACDGRLDDREFLNGISHTLLPIHELVKKCRSLGMDCVTPDAILENRIDQSGKECLLVTHLINERTDRLLEAGVKPFLLFCQESPMVATRFYADFRRHSGRFFYTMSFAGMKRRAHPKTTFLPMCFPIFREQTPASIPFEERSLLALIAANKSVPAWKSYLMKIYYGPSVKLIYPVRKKLVDDLARQRVIDLYGKGWDADPETATREAHLGLVPAGGKLDTLSRYKFTLCFENAIFPGYLTEKIFDALLAGSVPVYLGDPEISKSVPDTAFIDVRNFKSGVELRDRLTSMTKEEHDRYRTAGEAFLASAAFERFEHDTFIEKVFSLIHHYERRV